MLRIPHFLLIRFRVWNTEIKIMEIQSGDINSFPPEIQSQIRSQLLAQKMNSYGVEMMQIGDKVFEKSDLQGYDNLKLLIDFIPLEKGCSSIFKDEVHPMRICFGGDKIKTLTRFKKLIPVMIGTIGKKGIIGKLIALIYLRNSWKDYMYFVHMGLRDVYYPNVKYYSQPVREIYRLLNGEVRDIICALLEFDTAYRYRFQDIVRELNKKSFEENPIKEINRLIDIFFARGGKFLWEHKFGKIRTLLNIYLFLNKKLLNKLKLIVKEINLDEIKLSKEDIYWTNQAYQEYDFRGVPYRMRIRDYETEKQVFLGRT